MARRWPSKPLTRRRTGERHRPLPTLPRPHRGAAPRPSPRPPSRRLPTRRVRRPPTTWTSWPSRPRDRSMDPRRRSPNSRREHGWHQPPPNPFVRISPRRRPGRLRPRRPRPRRRPRRPRRPPCPLRRRRRHRPPRPLRPRRPRRPRRPSPRQMTTDRPRRVRTGQTAAAVVGPRAGTTPGPGASAGATGVEAVAGAHRFRATAEARAASRRRARHRAGL